MKSGTAVVACHRPLGHVSAWQVHLSAREFTNVQDTIRLNILQDSAASTRLRYGGIFNN